MTHPLPTATQQVTGPLSLEEFYAWVETTDDGVYYELVDGWPVVNPSPDHRHQLVLFRLVQLLAPGSPAGYVPLQAPLDWIVLPDRPTVRQPDLMVVPVRTPRLDREPPLLAVEVLSPSTRRIDLGAKRAEYAAGGLRHYWVVDPAGPEVIVFAGPGLVEADRARGDQQIVVVEPVAVTVTPSALVV